MIGLSEALDHLCRVLQGLSVLKHHNDSKWMNLYKRDVAYGTETRTGSDRWRCSVDGAAKESAAEQGAEEFGQAVAAAAQTGGQTEAATAPGRTAVRRVKKKPNFRVGLVICSVSMTATYGDKQSLLWLEGISECQQLIPKTDPIIFHLSHQSSFPDIGTSLMEDVVSVWIDLSCDSTGCEGLHNNKGPSKRWTSMMYDLQQS